MTRSSFKTNTHDNRHWGLSSYENHHRRLSPRNWICQKQSEIDISPDFHFTWSHVTPHNENFLSENSYEILQSNVFQRLTLKQVKYPDQSTKDNARGPSSQRSLFHTDTTTFSHVIKMRKLPVPSQFIPKYSQHHVLNRKPNLRDLI